MKDIHVVAKPYVKDSCMIAHPGSMVTLMKHDSLRGIRVVFINMPLRESAAQIPRHKDRGSWQLDCANTALSHQLLT